MRMEDSSVIQCAICTNKSNGFHFGVYTCGACKIFFKRNVSREVPHRCVGNTQTEQGKVYLKKERIHSCPRCRLEQCLLAGMSFHKIKRGRRAYMRKNENLPKDTQPQNESVHLPASLTSTPDGEKSAPEVNRESELLPPFVNTNLPSPFVLPREETRVSTNLPPEFTETSDGVAKLTTANSETSKPEVPKTFKPEVRESEMYPPGDNTRLIKSYPAAILSKPNNSDVTNICTPDDTLALEDADIGFDMVVKLLNTTPSGRLSPTSLVDPECDYLTPDGANDLPAIFRVSETPHGISETEHKSKYQNSSSPDNIPKSPSSIELEVSNLQENLSNIHLLSEIFPPDFHEKLEQRQRDYLEYRKLIQSMNNNHEFVPIEDFVSVYRRTRADTDGRMSSLVSRIKSKLRRGHSFLIIMSQTPGFRDISDIDKEAIASSSLTMFSTLTEHRCYNLSRGLHTTPEGVTSDITELRKELPMTFIEDLFKFAANVQALQLTDFEEHLLKSVLLFEPSCCLTVEGAKQVEKHKDFYIQVLDHIYSLNKSGKERPSLEQLFNIMETLQEHTKIYYENLREYTIDFSSKISSDIIAVSDLKPSEINVSAKYQYLDKALIVLLKSLTDQFKLISSSKNQ